jgi:hypothetical protein
LVENIRKYGKKLETVTYDTNSLKNDANSKFITRAIESGIVSGQIQNICDKVKRGLEGGNDLTDIVDSLEPMSASEVVNKYGGGFNNVFNENEKGLIQNLMTSVMRKMKEHIKKYIA